MNNMNNISETAILVSICIRQWSATKHDRKATREVEENHHTRDIGRFNKALIAKEALKAVTKAAGSARTRHYELSLPWDDSGNRIIPAAAYYDYSKEINSLQSQFEAAAREFCANYYDLKNEAQTRLNGLYNESDYPADIERRFEFKVKFSPVPVASDLRVKLAAPEVEKLRAELEGNSRSQLAAAHSDLWSRVSDVLTAMVERLKDSGDKPKTFRNSLVGNIENLIELAPKLDLTDDSNLKAICSDMKALCVDPQVLRDSPAHRSAAAAGAEEILNKVSAFM